MYVYGGDFSASAIDCLKTNPDYDEAKCKAFVCDITDLGKHEFPIKEGELDIMIMIFVLSAIKPQKYTLKFTYLTNLKSDYNCIIHKNARDTHELNQAA